MIICVFQFLTAFVPLSSLFKFLHLLFNNLKPTPYYNICQTSVKSHLQTHPYLQKPNYGLHKSRTIANITKNLVPSDVYGKVRQEFYERRREKEWRSKGFLEDPMNEVREGEGGEERMDCIMITKLFY